MTDFKVGDKVVFKDSYGDGQHWAVPSMTGTVVELDCNPLGNIRVEVILGRDQQMVGQFRPTRWKLLNERTNPTLEDARRLVALAEQIAEKTQDIEAAQAELEDSESEYKKLAEKLGIQ